MDGFIEALSSREFIYMFLALAVFHLLIIIINTIRYRYLAKKQQKEFMTAVKDSEESIKTIYSEIEEKRKNLLDMIEDNPKIKIDINPDGDDVGGFSDRESSDDDDTPDGEKPSGHSAS